VTAKQRESNELNWLQPRQHIAKKEKELHSFTMRLPCGQWKKSIAFCRRLRPVAQ
jgi:hypothetical protein